jgi:hypothetical protein
MTKLLCRRVSRGLREADVIATLRDVHGRRHFLYVEKDFLTRDNSHAYLPVAYVGRDARTGAVLIELPHEAGTGVNRLWVPEEDVRDGPQVAE